MVRKKTMKDSFDQKQAFDLEEIKLLEQLSYRPPPPIAPLGFLDIVCILALILSGLFVWIGSKV